ncbi:LytR/AlgR family response regulator transcription factor [Pseudoalteromonas tunicata]|jgi:two-component system LytT family response regulator|uniref:Two-component system, regulatory protein n=1 Tax=Pseudoalteromonas tunicata D2 TaxID=87626 RepID=A4C6V8_9GAMM|nr:LytTR family DNA-binding domain-containing protein [Pseudoalteromonas tunicata]ATC95682.1 two-component system, LytT family, response regulator [Pseudoalteromonas tunicata]AXT31243.1 DNA-binding response regulator [Pseudoalteromonas tunicata]EAR29712.1 two-component system, regulatory protein [Pseudoalteromonas tunicata D2]MDP4985043.1 LytTR family DNA-binding domain-containing protein [Pseudoalteromonas tunicata]MDP5214890.1 LytTR family DNA-binding domain-containing protein [Pseudoalterom
MTIKVIIVDDERLARNELKRLLAKHSQIEIIDEAKNADEAKEKIAEQKPDAIFLDIHMPGVTGLELAETLGDDVNIIFCTAYDQFAVDAFSLNAMDYLVKPVNPERLAESIAKLEKRVEQAKEKTSLPDDHKLMVKYGEKMRIIQLCEIIRFESIGNHAAIYTPHGKAYLHSSLNKIEKKLDEANYFRASRSDIVRLDAITSMEQSIGYGLLATLTNGQTIEISRRQATKLKQLLEFTQL